ncbi:MAG: type II toxin-antitoxin system VapB family antitoxin [Solirubrobacteraceae bacterium]
MIKRTTINLDSELVAEAREVLHTRNTTDTVQSALREVVRRERLKRLTEWDLGGLTLEDLKEMRRSRTETKPWGRFVEQ